MQGAQNTESCSKLALHTFLDGFTPDTLARDMGDSMTKYTLFASVVAAARGALLKSEMVQTLQTTVFSLFMEEAGTLSGPKRMLRN